jgi:CAAX prenyl protease-like protein
MGIKSSVATRIIPFALYLACNGLEDMIRFMVDKGLVHIPIKNLLYLYPIKALITASLIFIFMPNYQELRICDLKRQKQTVISIITGLVVFLFWINMNWSFGTFGKPQGFNPYLMTGIFTQSLLIITRICGAVLIVPVMEELFWRSFILRYIINEDIDQVPVATFSWLSFIITTILFGMEHNLFLAGMMAGAIYNLLLYYTKSISQCVLAHAVTNLALGFFILQTQKWYFW